MREKKPFNLQLSYFLRRKAHPNRTGGGAGRERRLRCAAAAPPACSLADKARAMRLSPSTLPPQFNKVDNSKVLYEEGSPKLKRVTNTFMI